MELIEYAINTICASFPLVLVCVSVSENWPKGICCPSVHPSVHSPTLLPLIDQFDEQI